MQTSIHLIGLSGSLRKGSYNTLLLKAAMELLPNGMTMEIAEYHDVPLYTGDLDLPIARERPPQVTRFRKLLAQADAFLIVSPEYNHSIPGGLKNAIDWASRGKDSPLINKPVGLMGATPGLWGTVRMQAAFGAVFRYLNMTLVSKPEVLVAKASEKFDADGKLIDSFGRDLVQQHLNALKILTLQLSPGRQEI